MIIVLTASCTGQNPPINPTDAGNPTLSASPTLATADSLPLTTTPQTPVPSSSPTPNSEQISTPTQISTVDISSSGTQTDNTNNSLFIPNTGSLPTPTNAGKTNKFQDFTIPVSDESPFSLLPVTGFPPGIRTSLKPQPSELQYLATDVTLEIPHLGIKISVVGVPKKDATWDVSWLSNQAGWLEGSAFPSWSGNSVLTAHFYLASGRPGPFVNLSTLKYGDRIIIHAYGQKNVFEVQTNENVAPNDRSVIKHEEQSWLTLITCADYVEESATYKERTVVRAVLVTVEKE
jgi:LPXTG-site transpeptidase (sortase) family protein